MLEGSLTLGRFPEKMLALRYLLYDLMDDMQRHVGDLIGYIMTDGPGG